MADFLFSALYSPTSHPPRRQDLHHRRTISKIIIPDITKITEHHARKSVVFFFTFLLYHVLILPKIPAFLVHAYAMFSLLLTHGSIKYAMVLNKIFA